MGKGARFTDTSAHKSDVARRSQACADCVYLSAFAHAVGLRAHAARKRGFAHPTDDERNPLYPSKYRIAPAALATTNVAEIQITAMMIHTDQ